MEAKEFRIGNYVTTKYGNDVIDFINGSGGFNPFRPFCFRTVGGAHEGECNPIPITEDILLKAGFKKTISNKDSGYVQLGLIKNGFDIMFCIESNCNPDCYVSSVGLDVKNLHQLQNLYFALTGEELTVNF